LVPTPGSIDKIIGEPNSLYLSQYEILLYIGLELGLDISGSLSEKRLKKVIELV